MSFQNLTVRHLFLLLLLLVTGCSTSEMRDVAQDELLQRINAKQSGLILDVRTPTEYAEGHVPGAINIPHDQLTARMSEVAGFKEKDVVVYCRSGKRAAIATDVLKQAGFSKLLHLQGDMSGWRENGLPVEK